MRKNIKSKQGYDIPCIYEISGDEDSIVVISHGLGSSKESPTVLALIERLKENNIAYIAYDFPAHGESPVDGEHFLISNCIEDLKSVVAYGKTLLPQGEVMYFSSSFGAYINLLYLSKEHQGRPKSVLRAAAVNMPGIFKARESQEFLELLEKQGHFFLADGYFRPLKITAEFCEELYNKDVFEKYQKGMAQLTMIHGGEDEIAAVADAVSFSKVAGAELTIVEGGKHRLIDDGQMAVVLDKAIEVFMEVS